MEFFSNVWKWLTDNHNEILAFLTSAQFIAIITVIVNAWKQHKVIKANTLSANTLSTELKENSKNKTILSGLVNESSSTLTRVNNIENELSDLSQSISVLTEKVNAILNVQSIVYTTLKDDTMRKTVNNILLNAKYNDTEVKTKIQNELNSLKEKVTNLSEGLKDIENSANKVNDTISDSSSIVAKNEEQVLRY